MGIDNHEFITYRDIYIVRHGEDLVKVRPFCQTLQLTSTAPTNQCSFLIFSYKQLDLLLSKPVLVHRTEWEGRGS